MTEHLTLISHNLCPYVQRAAIALLEKDVAFERITIDLSNKPDWFLAISPTGKVPLLRVARGDGSKAVLFESTATVTSKRLSFRPRSAPPGPRAATTRTSTTG
jgi:glutathione S-transferase